MTEISGQWLAIDIEIKQRVSSVGSVDYSKYVPRIWSGYSYLVTNQSIVKQKAIEFVRERIYEKRFTPAASLLGRLNAVAGESYDVIPSDFKNINYKPFEDAHNEQVVFLNNPEIIPNFIEAHPISEVLIYIPIGVEIEIKISSMPYLDGIQANLVTDPNTGDTNWELEGIPVVGFKPLESVNDDILTDVPPPITFDEFATSKGYISPSGLPNACSGAGFANPTTVMLNAVSAAYGASGGNPNVYQEILNSLIQDGAISQGQVNAIASQNPTYTPKQILEKLINDGNVTPEQINRAITKVGNPSPNNAIFNSGSFGSSGAQYCVTGRPLKIQRDLNNVIELEYIWSGNDANNCQFFAATSNPVTRLLSSSYSPAKTIFLRVYTGANNTGNYSLLNVTSTAKILTGNGMQAITLGDIVWRRGNTVYNTNVALPSRTDP